MEYIPKPRSTVTHALIETTGYVGAISSVMCFLLNYFQHATVNETFVTIISVLTIINLSISIVQKLFGKN